MLNRYQNIYGSRGLLTKVSRTSNGQTGILDVWDTTNNVIYDWKFGAKAYMSQRQFMKYGNLFPGNSITVFKYR
ncbi:MAG: hypothetical protein NVV82_19360 [Sporocytophaga sp.]|nr:hypothetical protein [Sporocytophaga sp.]